MWEWLIPLLATGGGALMQQLGGSTTEDSTQDWLNKYNTANELDPNNRDLNARRSNSFYDLLMNGNLSANNAMGQSNKYGTMAGDLLGMASKSANRSSTDIWDAFSKTQPGMIDYANSATNAAMMQNGSSMEDYANLQSQNAVRSIENALAKSGGQMGGAAYAALSRGAAEPLLAAQTQLGQMRSNLFQNNYQPMAQAGYGAEINRTNDLLNAMSGATNLQGNYGNIGSALASLLGQQSEQQIMAPSLTEKPDIISQLGGLLTGIGTQGLGNIDIMSLLGGKGNMSGGAGKFGSAGGDSGSLGGSKFSGFGKDSSDWTKALDTLRNSYR